MLKLQNSQVIDVVFSIQLMTVEQNQHSFASKLHGTNDKNEPTD
jgi:hypothetical protein